MIHLFLFATKIGEIYSPLSCWMGTMTPLSSNFWISASIISESLMLNVFLLGPKFFVGCVENSIYWLLTQLRTSESEVISFHLSRKRASWPPLKLCTLLAKYCFILLSKNKDYLPVSYQVCQRKSLLLLPLVLGSEEGFWRLLRVPLTTFG